MKLINTVFLSLLASECLSQVESSLSQLISTVTCRIIYFDSSCPISPELSH